MTDEDRRPPGGEDEPLAQPGEIVPRPRGHVEEYSPDAYAPLRSEPPAPPSEPPVFEDTVPGPSARAGRLASLGAALHGLRDRILRRSGATPADDTPEDLLPAREPPQPARAPVSAPQAPDVSSAPASTGSSSTEPAEAPAQEPSDQAPAAEAAPAAEPPAAAPATRRAPRPPVVRPIDPEPEPPPPRRRRGPRPGRGIPITAQLLVLTALATASTLMFTLVEPSPRWILVLGAAAAVLGLDGTLRQTWREPFASGADTAPFLFLPALYMLAVPVLVEHNVRGSLVIVAALAVGAGAGVLFLAELVSVRTGAPEYPVARLYTTAATYLTGFAVFSMTYVFDLGLTAAIAGVGIAAAMLAIEVLREGEVDPTETLVLAGVAGFIAAQARWVIYYLPLEGYLAGLLLLLVFYFFTSLLHSHVRRDLDALAAAQYAVVALAGVALVAAARNAGLA